MHLLIDVLKGQEFVANNKVCCSHHWMASLGGLLVTPESDSDVASQDALCGALVEVG